jgi:hypothetical protein
MRVLALIEDPQVIQQILTHLGRWGEAVPPDPARPPPDPAADLFADAPA